MQTRSHSSELGEIIAQSSESVDHDRKELLWENREEKLINQWVNNWI